MKSSTIGIREAKAQLSRLLKEVARGAEWTITDHGRPVARLVPPTDPRDSVSEQVARLQDWGWVSPPGKRNLPPPLPVEEGMAQRILESDRDRA